jgi:hypothetical protein
MILAKATMGLSASRFGVSLVWDKTDTLILNTVMIFRRNLIPTLKALVKASQNKYTFQIKPYNIYYPKNVNTSPGPEFRIQKPCLNTS